MKNQIFESQSQTPNKENHNLTNVSSKKSTSKWNNKPISKLAKKAKLLEKMKKLTADLKEKLKKYSVLETEKKESVLFLQKKESEELHKFVCYRDEEVLDQPNLRRMIIKRRVDNDADSDEEQLNNSITFLHSQLLQEVEQKNL